MNCRPEIKDLLIEKRMQRWWEIIQRPLTDVKCPTARARRNVLKLMQRYPQIAERLNLTVLKVYGAR
jgi:hypothetical protein